MKKSFIAIIALILVVIIVIAVVSCNTCNSCNSEPETESETKLSGSATGNQDKGDYTAIGQGKITVDSVNVRKEASGNANIVAGLYKDDIIDIISEEDGWAKIYYVGKHYTGFGYVSTSCFTDYTAESESESSNETNKGTGTESQTESETKKEATSYDETDSSGNIIFREVKDTVVVTADLLYVRKAPSTNAEIAGTITKNDKYDRIGISEYWSKIVYNNAEYYVASECVIHTADVDEEVREATVNAASLTVRAGIDYTSAEAVGYLEQGNKVTVIFHDANKFNGWARVYYVKDGEAIEGWLNAKYISIPTTETESSTQPLG